MRFEWHKLALLTCSAFVLMSGGSKMAEATSSPDQQQLAPTQVTPPEAVEDTLSPQEKEHLIIEEENVFDTNPPG
ncbi:MAG: hypothetical protein JSR85_03735 [Proteobacteria bacterium]|nr:hypothetical protein [Pseudomonadota bacterium]